MVRLERRCAFKLDLAARLCGQSMDGGSDRMDNRNSCVEKATFTK